MLIFNAACAAEGRDCLSRRVETCFERESTTAWQLRSANDDSDLEGDSVRRCVLEASREIDLGTNFSRVQVSECTASARQRHLRRRKHGHKAERRCEGVARARVGAGRARKSADGWRRHDDGKALLPAKVPDGAALRKSSGCVGTRESRASHRRARAAWRVAPGARLKGAFGRIGEACADGRDRGAALSPAKVMSGRRADRAVGAGVKPDRSDPTASHQESGTSRPASCMTRRALPAFTGPSRRR